MHCTTNEIDLIAHECFISMRKNTPVSLHCLVVKSGNIFIILIAFRNTYFHTTSPTIEYVSSSQVNTHN